MWCSESARVATVVRDEAVDKVEKWLNFGFMR